MATNVRCTNANVWKDGALRTCGWKGERYPRRLLTDSGVMYDTVEATAKPCPRCGGRVELISQEPGGGR